MICLNTFAFTPARFTQSTPSQPISLNHSLANCLQCLSLSVFPSQNSNRNKCKMVGKLLHTQCPCENVFLSVLRGTFFLNKQETTMCQWKKLMIPKSKQRKKLTESQRKSPNVVVNNNCKRKWDCKKPVNQISTEQASLNPGKWGRGPNEMESLPSYLRTAYYPVASVGFFSFLTCQQSNQALSFNDRKVDVTTWFKHTWKRADQVNIQAFWRTGRYSCFICLTK